MIDWVRLMQDIRYESDDHREDADLTIFAELHFSIGNTKRSELAEDTLYDAISSGAKRLLVYGRPGSGKSFLLKKLAYRLADELLVEVENNGGVFPPLEKTLIPIVVRLNRFDVDKLGNFGDFTFLELIRQQVDSTTDKEELINELINSGAKFVLIIDDLDEISVSNFSKTLQDIQSVKWTQLSRQRMGEK